MCEIRIETSSKTFLSSDTGEESFPGYLAITFTIHVIPGFVYRCFELVLRHIPDELSHARRALILLNDSVFVHVERRENSLSDPFEIFYVFRSAKQI